MNRKLVQARLNRTAAEIELYPRSLVGSDHHGLPALNESAAANDAVRVGSDD